MIEVSFEWPTPAGDRRPRMIAFHIVPNEMPIKNGQGRVILAVKGGVIDVDSIVEALRLPVLH